MIKLLAAYIKNMPVLIAYLVYDLLTYLRFNENLLFYGWGIHLYTGKFGQGKTCQAVADVYNLCVRYPQLTVLTNIHLLNFPESTRIIHLTNVEDILNAPKNTIVLIDEIGTLFNSRDFVGGKKSVPKSLFQHLCQCRKRKLVIFGTVQRFNLLDKQIRDITADVTSCNSMPSYPFTRMLQAVTFDIDEYEMYQMNPMYNPRIMRTNIVIQKNQYRQLYDTSELVQGLLEQQYISDSEILSNRGEERSIFTDGAKKSRRALKNRSKW
ncbi:MAG: AAA family ATPase [Clostridium sp.]|nr:AAA family ATPase [Clostridium sp.]